MDLEFNLEKAIETNSKRYGLPRPLIAALIQVESSGDIYAFRSEVKYRYLWDFKKERPFRRLLNIEQKQEHAPVDFPHPGISSRDTEFRGQQCSWGPMQIMGAVARELGFRKAFPMLCSEVGVSYGCALLVNLRKRFFLTYGWEGVVAAYNAGTPRRMADGNYINQYYIDRVAKSGFDFGGDSNDRV